MASDRIARWSRIRKPPKTVEVLCIWACILWLLFPGCSALARPKPGKNLDLTTGDQSSKEGERRVGNTSNSFFHLAAGDQSSPGRASLGSLIEQFRRPQSTAKPSHFRSWRPDLMVLPYAEIGSERVKIHNIRDCEYRTEENYDVRHYDREFALSDIRTVDFIVVPFQSTPLLAHTMLSFGLIGGEQVVISVEARLEQGEDYSAIGGALKEFELIYIVGSERDLIRLRTEVRKVDVYLYPAKVTPEQAQRLMLSMLGRVNEIARQPEFYDVLTNNCTTNIVEHVNRLSPGSIPNDIRVLLPGHSDHLAYDLGLLAAQGPFEQIRAASKINLVARLNHQAPDFSQRIRAGR